jgi:putative ABC transport system substrate-binding protein
MKREIFIIILFFMFISITPPLQATERTAHIGMIAFDTPFLAACKGLKAGMAEQGFVEGRDIVFSEYNVEKDKSRIPRLMEELATEKIDLVFTVTTPVVLRIRQPAEKHNIPIIFTVVADPVGAGLVSSLRHPETMSGISHIAFELVPRRLLLFKEAFPFLKKVAVFHDPAQKGLSRNNDNPELLAAANEAGVELVEFHIHNKEEMTRACAEITNRMVDGILMLPDTLTVAFFDQLVALSRREKLPMMVIDNMMLAKGGVMGYSPDFYDVGFQAAAMVKSVLDGVDPGNLPVQNPDKVKLEVSMKEVNRLGLAISPDFLIKADEIIR